MSHDERHRHGHQHGHGHQHVHEIQSLSSVFLLCIALNFIFVIIEAGVGFYASSLGLLSDAGHNLSDVFSLILALVAFSLAKVKSNERYTYGYKKSTILISLLNAILLLVAVGGIIIESLHKLKNPGEINGDAITWTAAAGIVINGFTAYLLLRQSHDDLNVRGAYLHMAADTLVSVGVLISGIIISYTGFTLLDPIISLVIAAVILISTWHLLSASLRLSLDGMPDGIDREEIIALLSSDERVKNVHHVHIWAISTTENALTAHLVIDDLSAHDEIKHSIKHLLTEKGIAHSTLETETSHSHCHEEECQSCGGHEEASHSHETAHGHKAQALQHGEQKPDAHESAHDVRAHKPSSTQ